MPVSHRLNWHHPDGTTGLQTGGAGTIYGVQRGNLGRPVVAGVEVAYNGANWATYGRQLEEEGNGTYRFVPDDDLPVGTFEVTLYQQVGATPALGDTWLDGPRVFSLVGGQVVGSAPYTFLTGNDLSGISAVVTTVSNKIGAFTGSGINSILGFFRALLRKDAALTPSDVGGTYDNTTDSLEAQQESSSGGDLDAIASSVWAYATRTLTMTAIELLAALEGFNITVYRGDTIDVDIPGLGNISNRDKLYFTVKEFDQQEDNEAILQIEEIDGLLYFKGTEIEVPDNVDGGITVTDQVAGNVTLSLIASRCVEVEPKGYIYSIKEIEGEICRTKATGVFVVAPTATKAVT